LGRSGEGNTEKGEGLKNHAETELCCCSGIEGGEKGKAKKKKTTSPQTFEKEEKRERSHDDRKGKQTKNPLKTLKGGRGRRKKKGYVYKNTKKKKISTQRRTTLIGQREIPGKHLTEGMENGLTKDENFGGGDQKTTHYLKGAARKRQKDKRKFQKKETSHCQRPQKTKDRASTRLYSLKKKKSGCGKGDI